MLSEFFYVCEICVILCFGVVLARGSLNASTLFFTLLRLQCSTEAQSSIVSIACLFNPQVLFHTLYLGLYVDRTWYSTQHVTVGYFKSAVISTVVNSNVALRSQL